VCTRTVKRTYNSEFRREDVIQANSVAVREQEQARERDKEREREREREGEFSNRRFPCSRETVEVSAAPNFISGANRRASALMK